MNEDQTESAALVDEVGVELDELRRAGDQLDEAVALQFGLNRTDLRCLGILYRRGRVTAGELAEESGLTPGAITTVLDRLERGGYANRVPDPADRRRVLVVSTVATREIGARIQGEVELASRRLLEGREAAELTCIRDFLRGTRSVYEAQIAALTAEGAPGAPPREGGVKVELALEIGGKDGPAQSSAPLGSATAGRLEFTKGAAKVSPQGRPVADRPVPGELRRSGARDHRQRQHGRRAAAPPLPAVRLARPVGRLHALDRRALGHLPARRHVEARRRPQRAARHEPGGDRRRQRHRDPAARARGHGARARERRRQQGHAAPPPRHGGSRRGQRRCELSSSSTTSGSAPSAAARSWPPAGSPTRPTATRSASPAAPAR